jgi:Kef-type K+ transport system membrane component KefB
MLTDPIGLVVIMGAVVVAPLLAEVFSRFRIPSVLFEIVLGIIIGTHVLGWAEVTDFVDAMSTLGLSFLMFMAGYEVDLPTMRGKPLNLALKGYVGTLVLGLAVAGVLVLEGFVLNDLLVGLALTTTALGVLLPMMSDRHMIETSRGRFLLGAGSVGEFGPIVMITLLLSGNRPVEEALLLLVFIASAVGAGVLAMRPQPPAFIELLQRHFYTSSQLPVRITMLLLSVMVLFAFELKLDTILGAFTAGMLLRLLRDEDNVEILDLKLQAIGYGFLIPIFFVVSGMNFDLDALLNDPATFLRVPIFLALFFGVRGLPALWVYRHELPPRARLGLALLQSTALPLVVVITTIGLESEKMKPATATSLVGAAMLSVLVYPLTGFALYTPDLDPEEDLSDHPVPEPDGPSPA